MSVGSVYAADPAVVVDGIAYNVVDGAAEVAALPDGTTKYTGTLTIPANVTINGTSYAVNKIGDNSLRDAPALTAVVIPEGLKTVGNSAFASCTGITSIVLPASVDSIADWAFYGCTNLASINIPDGITTITGHLFQGSGLTSITLPASVKSIKVCGFQDAHQLASINLENITQIENWVFYATAITSVNVSNVFSIGGDTFQNCPNLQSVVLRNVSDIGSWCFSGCPKLSSVDLGTAVESLETGVFSGCPLLTTLTIPNTLVYIGDWALEKNGLTKVYVSWADPTVPYFEAHAFGDDPNKPNMTWMVPAALLDIYGPTWNGFPVAETDITGLKNVQLENTSAYYAEGNLNLKGFQGYAISIVSIDGRTIAHFAANELNNIKVPATLTSGIYLVNATKGNNRAVAKFIVR
ncbi:MAG: leucine-rich repeat protein [Candidatus Paceibacterota bacterium]